MALGGSATVLVVNDQNTVELRPIDIDRNIGTKVLVSHGLKAGERIIVEGSQKAPPGIGGRAGSISFRRGVRFRTCQQRSLKGYHGSFLY